MHADKRTDHSRAFLHASAQCLALVSRGELHLTPGGHLHKASQKNLVDAVILSDPAPVLPPSHGAGQPALDGLAEAQGPLFVLGMLRYTGMVAADGKRLWLSDGAYDWLNQPAERQLQSLRRIWFFAPELTWCWLPAERCRPTLVRRWRFLIFEALQLVSDLSPEAWTPVAEPLNTLEAGGVSRWKEVAHNLPRVRRSVRRHTGQMLRFLLWGVLPSMGLVEVRREARVRQLRPTQEGLAWMRAALEQHRRLADPPPGVAVEQAVPHYEQHFLPSGQVSIDVTLYRPGPQPATATAPRPGFSVTIQPQAPAACIFHLAHLGRLEAPGFPARYYLTHDSLLQAAEWDYSLPEVILLLTRYSGGLPPGVAGLLEEWRDEAQVIPCEPGYRLDLGAPATLNALRRRDPFRQRTAPLASGRQAWVGRSEARALFRYLRRLGYVVQIPEERQEREAAPAQPRPGPWPLGPWLALLRTYEHLRQRLPGLADLQARELAGAAEAALRPEERAAVEWLMASQKGLLDEALGTVVGSGMEASGMDDAGRTSQENEANIAALRERLEAAIRADARLNLRYVDTLGRVTERRVRPLYLETRWDRVYLVAFCELRQDERNFRLDRIVSAESE
jgi:hypothetical protein